jgi:pimeloyl-ACP methyl ester carboxylesterase/DNA-binding CsgD family transcriptional regulator
MIAFPIHYATSSDGVRIAYATFGDGPPVVFASNMFGDLSGYRLGWPHTRDVTDQLVALGWRVVQYDVRGMGSSDRDVADLGLTGRVRDLAAVIGQLELDRFALAAVDIGCATAVAYAVRHREAVSHLALLSPWAPGARYLQIPALRAAMAVAERETNHDPELAANIVGSVATGFKDAELVRLGTEMLMQRATPEGLAASVAATRQIDITDLLPQVQAPTLVVHEPPFPFGSFELCQEVAAGIPHAELVIIAENSIAGRVHDANIAALDRFLRVGTAKAHTPEAAGEASATAGAASHGLTVRETQVLRLVAGGSKNKEIANELGVSVSTVERHLVNLYTKIRARGRADAIAYALRHRIAAP